MSSKSFKKSPASVPDCHIYRLSPIWNVIHLACKDVQLFNPVPKPMIFVIVPSFDGSLSPDTIDVIKRRISEKKIITLLQSLRCLNIWTGLQKFYGWPWVVLITVSPTFNKFIVRTVLNKSIIPVLSGRLAPELCGELKIKKTILAIGYPSLNAPRKTQEG